ncbi:hypothetical protein F383_36031 [Gossypium arboreum]|nr:hypothetical protein F383_37896 [Gossypium arboreum]KHG13547.1 hypothetical protein F383_18260 [Gossypium arboreum]KHG29917.1 hypothetical protein F383_36031 [Gossypium arboreum]
MLKCCKLKCLNAVN